MSETVTLKKDDVSLTLPVPKQGHGADECTELTFRDLTDEQKDALAAFFKKTVCGMKELWTYVDSHGRSFPTRFTEPALVFVRFKDGWDVSVGIEKGPDALRLRSMEARSG